MSKKFLKKIIVQSPEDLAVISALCSESKVLQSEIKYLKQNKVFLFPVTRKNDGNNNSKKKNRKHHKI